jgi:uncharacterized surface protein with fasciclin (FAS1) repeats
MLPLREDIVVSVHNGIQVDAAHVLDGDVEASNGLIHVIDSVLLPGAI